MEGIILFADDDIFDAKTSEYKLFHKLNSDSNYPTLPINDLSVLEKTISSISTYKAIILDWNFKRKEIEEVDVILPDETPYKFLTTNKIYSLVYVYSRESISPEIKEELTSLYSGKIFFESKTPSNSLDSEYKKVLDGIKNFEEKNQHLAVPFIWSQAINQSAQMIFSELEDADSNWIKEIFSTAKDDGAEPTIEVINVFQNILNESIIQNKSLLQSINEYGESARSEEQKEESLAKLYNRIYYTRLTDDAPIMTGDIFKFSDDDFAILFTPECDIHTKKDTSLEFILFKKNDFEYFLTTKKQYSKNKYPTLKQKQLKDLTVQFNNGNISYHILPSFPFENDKFKLSAFINFESAFVVKQKVEFDGKREKYKLNSPFIYQLRQRYLSYIGRVGVPAIPESLRLYNLK